MNIEEFKDRLNKYKNFRREERGTLFDEDMFVLYKYIKWNIGINNNHCIKSIYLNISNNKLCFVDENEMFYLDDILKRNNFNGAFKIACFNTNNEFKAELERCALYDVTEGKNKLVFSNEVRVRL